MAAESSEKQTRQNGPAADVHTVAIRVKTMTCVAGCFNGIRTVIEKREGIESVKLAPQKEEDLIDNSLIYVSYRGELDRKEIERLVIGAGDRLPFSSEFVFCCEWTQHRTRIALLFISIVIAITVCLTGRAPLANF
jgi:copper chaperone CopZ